MVWSYGCEGDEVNAPISSPSSHPVAELFVAEGDFVYRTLRYLGVEPDAIDDALQDVFVTAYRRWSSFEGRSTARTWLYGIARRVAFRYRRKHRSHRTRFVLHEMIDAGHRPFEKARAGHSVTQLLAALDEPKRAAFILVEVEGMTAAEAAAALQIPLGTVYSRVRAAWQRLRGEAAAEQESVRSLLPRPRIPEQRRHDLRRAIVAACAPQAVAAGSMTAVATWAVLGLVVSGAALATAVGMGSQPPPVVAELPSEATPDPGPARARAGTSKPDPTPEPNPRSTPAVAPLVPAADPGSPSAPTPQRTTAKQSSPANADPDQRNTLQAELALLRAAREALTIGDAEAAHRALNRHAREFPRGQLRDEREEVRRQLPDSTTTGDT